jgi:ribosomal protein S27AE
MPDQPGRISDTRVCPECGEFVAIDSHGRCLCFTCGHFVDAIDANELQKLPKGKDIQIPLFKRGWGIPE